MNRKYLFWTIVILLALYWVLPKFYKVHQLEQQRGQLQNDIRSLYERTKTLENEVRLLKDDPIYIEHIARKKFRKAKEGEVIYKIVDPADMNSN